MKRGNSRHIFVIPLHQTHAIAGKFILNLWLQLCGHGLCSHPSRRLASRHQGNAGARPLSETHPIYTSYSRAYLKPPPSVRCVFVPMRVPGSSRFTLCRKSLGRGKWRCSLMEQCPTAKRELQ